MTLLAVDPSLRSSGAALFCDDILTAVTTIKLLRCFAADSLAHRCRRMAFELADWAIKSSPAREQLYAAGQPAALVLEWPQIYRTAKSKGDPNDLLGLAGVCGALAARLQLACVYSYTPAEWAGQLPKATTKKKASPREARILSRLSDAECALLTHANHDAIDAVGLGLHFLGRLKPTRRFAGASE